MGNCLKTQLKGIVDSPDLPVIGEFRISVPHTTDGDARVRQLLVQGISPGGVTIEVVSGTGYIGTSSADLANEKRKLENVINNYIYLTNVDMVLSISSKYDIRGIDSNYNGNRGVQSGDINELDFCENLERLSIAYSEFYGNINKLRSTKITTLSVGQSKCTGSIEEFVKNQYALGRTQVTKESAIDIMWTLKTISFGSVVHDIRYSYLTWSDLTHIAIYTGAVGGISNCTTVYCSGYDSQAAAEAALLNGNVTTVIRVDAQ